MNSNVSVRPTPELRLDNSIGPVENHTFVCLNCGCVFDLKPVLDRNDRLLRGKAAQIVAVQVTIEGYCSTCWANGKEGGHPGMH